MKTSQECRHRDIRRFEDFLARDHFRAVHATFIERRAHDASRACFFIAGKEEIEGEREREREIER